MAIPITAAAATDPGDWARGWIADAADRLDNASARNVVEWSLATFAPRVCLATSFGPQTIVMMHWIAELGVDTPIVYLDTGLLFPQTHALREQLVRRLGLRFVALEPAQTVTEQAIAHGDALWNRDPDRCCFLRKVAPLGRYLANHHAWLTGIRNRHGATRARARVVEWDPLHRLVKINPLVRWTDAEVWRYLRDHDLPFNSLHNEGYPSIGCMPCTRAVVDGDDPRSGRWASTTKTECGIHGRPPEDSR